MLEIKWKKKKGKNLVVDFWLVVAEGHGFWMRKKRFGNEGVENDFLEMFGNNYNFLDLSALTQYFSCVSSFVR